MAKTRGESRADRLGEMKRLYIQQAFSDIEMAERLSVARETVFKDRSALEANYPFVEVERGRYKIDKSRLISEVKVNLNEALALYLAAQRMARQTRTAQSHVASAVEKLADVLRQPMTQRLVRSAASVLKQTPSPERARMLDQIATAWVEQRKVYIKYHALSGGRVLDHALSPYLIEPSLWGEGAYVIGHSDRLGRVGPFKIERIQEASVSGETFEIPDTFDEQELMKHAWGVWTAEGRPPETVRLRFTGATAIRRLRETIWHPLEDEHKLPDGSWEWSAPVAEWREMLPWVRGWGADVEVMEPEEMREAVVRDVERLSAMYSVSIGDEVPADMQRVLRCWGKTAKQGDFHPALYHMLNVGHVASWLLNDEASPRWRNVLTNAFGWTAEEIHAWIPFLVALHDIGKISTSFAGLNAIQKSRLIQEGFAFGVWTDNKNAPHATVGQAVLSDVFGAAQVTAGSSLLLALQTIVGGHHGVFVKQSDLKVAKQNLLAYEPAEWAALRASAAAFLKDKLVPSSVVFPKSILNQSTAIAALTGFTILCDWIGSDANHFVPRSTAHPDAYLRESFARARTAVAACGLTERVLSTSATQVQALFPKLNPPRPLQRAIDEIPNELLSRPCLAIIEAPTGEGKTEAAFALAHRLATASGTDELYCALPTMATSNQMFTRLQKYLQDSLGLTAHASLVHGQAFLMEDELRIEPMDNGDGTLHAQPVEWFSSKKRALLAPFGTGTVDQGELAALNVRHAMLHMIGLAGKVVILDEVHAYDTYMTTIIERLLQWLSALGSSVVLLSATLPSKQRASLMQAYGSHGESMPLETYPALTIASANQPLYQVSPAAWQPDRLIQAQAFYIGEDAPEDRHTG